MVSVGGVQVLFDCPLDLSALTIFSPVPTEFYEIIHEETSDSPKRQRVEKPLDANGLIYAEPWYKTLNNLHLWNVSFIDIVLISSPMGMIGLPFLTRKEGFSAKVMSAFRMVSR